MKARTQNPPVPRCHFCGRPIDWDGDHMGEVCSLCLELMISDQDCDEVLGERQKVA